MLLARISRSLFRHPSLSSIASGRSSRLHPVSVESYCRLVLAGCPTLARPCEGVRWGTSLMSSSLLLQQRPASLVRLIWMVFWWSYSCRFVECCFQDLFNIARSILVQLPSSFFSVRLVSVQGMHPYSSMDTDYADDITLLTNAPAQVKTLLHCLERAAGGIGLHVNTDKTEYTCFNQRGNISTLNGGSQKLVDKFAYLGSCVSSTENDINTRLAKPWTGEKTAGNYVYLL